MKSFHKTTTFRVKTIEAAHWHTHTLAAQGSSIAYMLLVNHPLPPHTHLSTKKLKFFILMRSKCVTKKSMFMVNFCSKQKVNEKVNQTTTKLVDENKQNTKAEKGKGKLSMDG